MEQTHTKGTVTLSQKLKAHFISGRPFLWVNGGICILTGVLLTNKVVTDWVSFLLLITVIPSLFSYFANTFNAAFDVEADVITKKNRPIPSGIMSRQEAIFFSLLAALVGILLSIFVIRRVEITLILILEVVLSIAYSIPTPRLKSVVYISNFMIAVGYTLFGLLIGWSYLESLTNLTLPKIMVMAILTIQTSFATISKDLVDMAADKAVNCRTLPLVFGEKTAVYLVILSLWLPYAAFTVIFIFFSNAIGLTYFILFLIFPWALVETKKLHEVLGLNLSELEKAPYYKTRFMSVFLYTTTLIFLVGIAEWLAHFSFS